MAENRGLFNKYIITKTDGSPVDPSARYFVLRVDTDPAARQALLHYAACVEPTNPAFADAVRQWVTTLPFNPSAAQKD